MKAGQDHTCFLTNRGHVLTCGWSADGQLGQNIFTVNSIPKRVEGDLKVSARVISSANGRLNAKKII